MYKREEIVSFFENNFQRVTYNDKEINCSCPLCGDSLIDPERKRRFHYNFEKDQWHCFNCGKGWKVNGFRELVKRFGNTKEKIKYYIPLLKNKKVKLSSDKKQISLKEIYNKFKEITKNDNELTSRDILILNEFRIKRQIPYTYPLYIGKESKNDKKYGGYIIIPIYIYSEIYWWVARRIDFYNKNKIKYLKPEFNFEIKTFPYFNKHRFNKNEPIIIVESIIDALISENNNITSVSGIPSYKHILNLLNFTDIGVIVALDQDKTGFRESKKILDKVKFNKKIKFFYFKNYKKYGKDFSDFVENGIIKPYEIYDFILENTIKSNIKYEIFLKKEVK